MFEKWFIELLGVIESFTIIAAAITAAGVGIYGVRQWFLEIREKARFETAKKIAVLTLRFRDDFHEAKGPQQIPFDYDPYKPLPPLWRDVNKTQKFWVMEFLIRAKMMEPLETTNAELTELSWEAEVILGSHISDLIKPLNKAGNELIAALSAYEDLYNQSENPEKESPYDMEAISPLLDKLREPEDDLTSTVDQATANLLNELKKITQ